MATLYELTDKYKYILDQATNGLINEDEFDELLNNLNLEEDLKSKVDDYLYVIDEASASSKRIGDEIKRLQERKSSTDNKVKRLKETLLEAMQATGNQKIKTDRYTMWTQKNPLSIKINDTDNIPRKYFIEQKPKIDKRGLIEHFKNTGEIISGVEFTQGEGVRYR